jgi:hypothetical protein
MYKLQSERRSCKWITANAYINSHKWKVPRNIENSPRNRHRAIKEKKSPPEISSTRIEQTEVNQQKKRITPKPNLLNHAGLTTQTINYHQKENVIANERSYLIEETIRSNTMDGEVPHLRKKSTLSQWFPSLICSILIM